MTKSFFLNREELFFEQLITEQHYSTEPGSGLFHVFRLAEGKPDFWLAPFMAKEKKKKTILLSSEIFHEVEKGTKAHIHIQLILFGLKQDGFALKIYRDQQWIDLEVRDIVLIPWEKKSEGSEEDLIVSAFLQLHLPKEGLLLMNDFQLKRLMEEFEKIVSEEHYNKILEVSATSEECEDEDEDEDEEAKVERHDLLALTISYCDTHAQKYLRSKCNYTNLLSLELEMQPNNEASEEVYAQPDASFVRWLLESSPRIEHLRLKQEIFMYNPDEYSLHPDNMPEKLGQIVDLSCFSVFKQLPLKTLEISLFENTTRSCFLVLFEDILPNIPSTLHSLTIDGNLQFFGQCRPKNTSQDSTPLTPLSLPTIRRLYLSDLALSLESLMALIRSMPNLEFLMLECVIYQENTDGELDILLQQYPLIKIVDQSLFSYSQKMWDDKENAYDIDWDTPSYMMTIPGNFFLFGDSLSEDANTKNDDGISFARAIFLDENGCELEPEKYRLKTYNQLILRDIVGPLDDAFTLSNDTSVIESLNSSQTPFYVINSSHSSVVSGQTVSGTDIIPVMSTWQALPSCFISEELQRLDCDPDLPFEVKYSHEASQYFIRFPMVSDKKTVTINFVLEKKQEENKVTCYSPAQEKAALKVRTLRKECNDLYHDGEMTLTQGTGRMLLDEIKAKHIGACRHRVIVFLDEIAQYNQTEVPGDRISVRACYNEIHAYVEVKLPGQDDWFKNDLGGYEAEIEMYDVNDCIKDIADAAEFKSKEASIASQPIDKTHYMAQLLLANQAPTTLPEFCEELFSGNKKKILVELASEVLFDFQCHLHALAADLDQRVFYVHSIRDLFCPMNVMDRDGDIGTLQRVQAPSKGSGKLYEFLTETPLSRLGERRRPSVLIINMNHFSANDVIRYNTLWDNPRSFHNILIPEDVILIGLRDPNKEDQYNGADFLSRLDMVLPCPEIEKINKRYPAFQHIFPENPRGEEEHSNVINLYHRPDWYDYLLGAWVPENGHYRFRKGVLATILNSIDPASGALLTPLKTLKRLVIKNPPQGKEFEAFELFWRQAKRDEYINYQGDILSVNPAMPIDIQDDAYADMHLLAKNVEKVRWSYYDGDDRKLCGSLILNSVRLFSFIQRYDCQDGAFLSRPGFFEQHAKSSMGQLLNIFLSEPLTQDQWGLFFQAYEAYVSDFSLNIVCVPRDDNFISACVDLSSSTCAATVVVLPAVAQTSQTSHTYGIISDDPDFTIATMQFDKSAKDRENTLVLDIAECWSSDLIETMVVVKNEMVGIDQFEKIDCLVKKTLALSTETEPQTVILTGDYSKALPGLSAFLLERLQSLEPQGRLIMVGKQAIEWLRNEVDLCSKVKKKSFFERMGFGPELAVLEKNNPACLKESYHVILTRLRYTRAHASVIHPVLNAFNLFTSYEDTRAFLSERFNRLHERLAHSPFLFLEGLTGVGKSHYIEKVFIPTSNSEGFPRTLFQGTDEETWIQWATADTRSVQAILFIDEANLLGRQLTEFKPFDPPSIRIRGQNYPLHSGHKVIFAGNPDDYGDERQIIDLFGPSDMYEIFYPLPMCVIYEQIIKPMLMNFVSEGEILTVSSTIAPLYEWLIKKSKKDVLISPRQVQEIIRHILLKRIDGILITPEIAKTAVYDVIAPRLPKSLLNEGRERHESLIFSSVIESIELISYAPSKWFLATSSRIKSLQALNDFLAIRLLSRSPSAPAALAYGGLNRFVIEGEPGVGKSEMALAVLFQQNFQEIKKEDINERTAQMLLISTDENYFFRISAADTFDTINAILTLAFKTGSVVLVDEINSLPAMEQLLNSYLDGKDLGLHEYSVIRPGFRLIGTQNPATREGRGLVSYALNNRTHTEILAPYSSVEMVQILQASYALPAEKIEELVAIFDQLVQEQRSNKKEGLVFRDLLSAANELAQNDDAFYCQSGHKLKKSCLTSISQSFFSTVQEADTNSGSQAQFTIR